MPLMTKADYAARGIKQYDGSFKKCSKAYLSKGAMKARLEPAMRADTDGVLKIDSDMADQILRETKDPSRSMSHMKPTPGTASPKTGTFEAVRTDRERAKLENEQLDLAERKGETMSRVEVVRAVMAAGQIIKDQLKNNSRRLAEKFSTMTDVREIRSVMEQENSALLTQISNDFLRRLPNIDIEREPVTSH